MDSIQTHRTSDAESVPLLAAKALPVVGGISGRTYITRAAPETTDDEGPDHARLIASFDEALGGAD